MGLFTRRFLAAGFLALPFSAPALAQGELAIIAQRPGSAEQEPFARFTRETGIRLHFVPNAGNAAVTALGASPRGAGDVMLGTDASALAQLEAAGVFEPYASAATARVPAHLRHPANLWTGVSARARILVVRKDDGAAPATLAELAEPRFRGRVCPTAPTAYNLSVTARMVGQLGEEGALRWAKGVAANFAPDVPLASDFTQIQQVAAGRCAVAISNHYYLLRLGAPSAKPEEREAAARLRVAWPDQAAGQPGAMLNVTAIGLLKGAPNRENAIRFIDFMMTEQAQAEFGGGIFYATLPGAPVPPAVRALGEPRFDTAPVAGYGAHREAAMRILREAAWPMPARR
ncbi:iron(III) transport system substrate-binding protein [Roseomonas rosea]|uniref:Iron(III) transport system substrate-binding protein n=1 Tax=Muricoccus roseus TaxID=198092 RepID=A0A1M6KZX8_9PROT|nr:extracellular solute-binding protein [Roseomonas rosea]SHJ64429.1 iron(III) transport system substrate-binding protein [Roseomonas rosea]